ncbi:hypothetical protein ACHAWO_006028 [Cyclotella atomus]|uniref:Uncharacterized protein n=1 Tax=Cyclotella atomus TaxID=382360 RepID=A0ABD3MLN8_9STRA
MEKDTLALTTFGTSLSLTTTLRNSIQSEISTLDAASLALSKAIASESSIQRSIRKEMERAKREMMEISREGGEVVENEVVHSNVCRGWKEEVAGMQEILREFSVVSDDEGDNGDGQGGMKLIPKMKMMIQTKNREHVSLRRELEGYKSTVANLDDETSRIQVESGRLNAQNSKLQGEVEKKRMELEGETRRNGRVKEAIGRSRGKSGGFARAIADKAQEQITERSNNLSKESALQADLESKNQEVACLSAEEKKLDAELALLSGFLASFIQQHVEAEAEVKRGVVAKAELDEVKAEVVEIIKVKEAKFKVRDDAAKDLEEAKKVHDTAAAAAKELETIKAENDKADAEVLEPALKRKAEASNEKERLAGEVNELHKVMAELQRKMNEAVAGTDAKTAVKAEELKNAKEQLEKAKSSLDDFLKSAAAQEETNAKELKETKDFTAHFEAATQGEITRLDTMKRQKTDERLAKLDQRRSELASLEDVRREGIKHLEDALDFLEQMKDVEAAIKDAEVELTEDGEELLPALEEHKEVFADLKDRIESAKNNEHGTANDRDDMETQASPSTKRRQ